MYPNPQPKDLEELASPFQYPIIETKKLFLNKKLNEVNFWEVVEKRRSRRSFHLLSLDDLSIILWHCAKVKQGYVQDNGYILTERPSPSAGARHPIDILIMSSSSTRNNQLSYYNPFEHSLNILDLPNEAVNSFKNHICSIVEIGNGTLVWFLAHPDRTAAKYDNAISLIWRDAGALLQTVQLVCEASRINSCPIGSLGEPFVSKMFSPHGNVFGVGGIIIG